MVTLNALESSGARRARYRPPEGASLPTRRGGARSHRDRGGIEARNAARARTSGGGLLAALAAVLLILALVLASGGH
jgi:hypothetical protein